jgi:predicted RNA-binding Zn-ribbon protein involved in translation (DUF1610 family)
MAYPTSAQAFDCDKCGARWLASGNRIPGHASFEDVTCPKCGNHLGTIRCDAGLTDVTQRPANWKQPPMTLESLGWVEEEE